MERSDNTLGEEDPQISCLFKTGFGHWAVEFDMVPQRLKFACQLVIAVEKDEASRTANRAQSFESFAEGACSPTTADRPGWIRKKSFFQKKNRINYRVSTHCNVSPVQHENIGAESQGGNSSSPFA